MSEFSDVMKQAKRMCEAQEDCDECPIGMKLDCVCVIADLIEMMDAKEIERIVMDWAAENPEPRYPSWREWQESNFVNSTERIYPCYFMSRDTAMRIYGVDCHKPDCYKCADNLIPADIAEKLRIKPIGGCDNG